MTQKQRRFLLAGAFLLIIFLERRILSPFFLAVIVSYLLVPLVNLIHRRLKLPRLSAVVIIYLAFVSLLFLVFSFLATQLIDEVRELRFESADIVRAAQIQFQNMPEWLRNLSFDSVHSLQNALTPLPTHIFPFFTGAVSQVINLVLFLATTFYLLKDWEKIGQRLRKTFLDLAGEGAGPLLGRISETFSLFLKGELFLILLMTTLSYIFLILLNVKFALILSIFTGLAEIIPIVGPVVATIVAASVAVLDGRAMLGLDPLMQGGLVVLIYFLLRQFEDVVIIPQVMGRITRVHPLLVMFAVIAGGHLAGFWGLLLALPVLAAGRIIIEEYW